MTKKIIYFSGAYRADILGSTRAIDLNIIKRLSRNGIKVTWVGRGVSNEEEINTIDLNELKNFTLLEKIIFSLSYFIYRSLHKLNLKNIAVVWLYSHFDRRCASLINNKKVTVDKDTILVGRNGMSLQTMKCVKKLGGVTLIHSQWMHPYVQDKILREEFNKLGLETKPISPLRIKRQILEIAIADKIWCISSLVYSSYIRNQYPEEKLFILPLGIDVSNYYPKESLSSLFKKRSENFKILFVGSVNPEKGTHLLIEAIYYSGIKNIEVIFNGGIHPYYKDNFSQMILKLKERNISVKVEPGNPSKNYLDCSLLVLPSVHESFGMVVLEAMSSGLPVIVSDNVGASDCVIENKNGFIFKNRDMKQLAEKILYFYSERRNIEEYGLKSLEYVKKYDWDIISKEFISLMDSNFEREVIHGN